MNKRFLINTLALLFNFSAFAAKPNIQQNKRKRAPIAKQNVQKVKPVTQADASLYGEQTKTPTMSESWNKVARFEWSTLSKNDAWNIGATIVTCGAIAYLYNYMQKGPLANNAILNPPDNQGPDNGNRIHIPIPPKQQIVNNPVLVIPVNLPANNQPVAPIHVVPLAHTDEKKECELCGEEKNGHEFCALSCCNYNATCSDCMTEMINIALKEKTTAELKCPNRNCTQSICEHDMRAIAGGKLDDYHNVTVKEYLDKNKEQNGIKFCPTPDCPYAFENDTGHKQLTTCPLCKHTYCSNCCVEHSMQRTCDQAKEDLKLKENKTKEEKETEEWLKNNTKACPQCKAPVEKRGGCLTMLCTRCQHQFCWKCLQPHDHTMNHACGLWDNDAQMNQAHQDLLRQLANDNLQHIHNPAIGMNNGNFGNFINNVLQGIRNDIEIQRNDLMRRNAQLQQRLQNNRVNIGNAAQNQNNVNINANRPNNNANVQNNNRPAANANNARRPVVNNANNRPVANKAYVNRNAAAAKGVGK